MLSKCANPACLARFRYLRQGRIFNIETGSVFSGGNGSPSHKIEHFWLCERCAQTLKVVVENGVITIRPLHLELTEGKPPRAPERKLNVA